MKALLRFTKVFLFGLILSLQSLNVQAGPPPSDPCSGPNPPSWCTGGGGPCSKPNPPAWCTGINVPINQHLIWLIAAGIGLGLYTIRMKKD